MRDCFTCDRCLIVVKVCLIVESRTVLFQFFYWWQKSIDVIPYSILKGSIVIWKLNSYSTFIWQLFIELGVIYHKPLPKEKCLVLSKLKLSQTNLDSSWLKEFAADDFEIAKDGRKFKGWKTLLEKKKLLMTSNFSFFHSVFKRLVLQTRKNKGLFGKGWKLKQTTILMWFKWSNLSFILQKKFIVNIHKFLTSRKRICTTRAGNHHSLLTELCSLLTNSF